MRPPPLSVIATTCALLAGVSATAADWKMQSISTKRQAVTQVFECMKKRMSSDRLISYNAAAKACKDEVGKRLGIGTSGPLVAADAPGK
jgi:hypothetical protein